MIIKRIGLIVFFVLMLLASASAYAEEVLLVELSEICTAKANVAAYAITHREKTEVKGMIELLDKDWKVYSKKAHFKQHVYTDMVRVLHEAHRKGSKGYAIPSATSQDVADFVNKEILACAKQGF